MSTSKDILQDKIFNLNEKVKKLTKYKKGYDLLISYFDCIPQEEKKEIHKHLNRLGL